MNEPRLYTVRDEVENLVHLQNVPNLALAVQATVEPTTETVWLVLVGNPGIVVGR